MKNQPTRRTTFEELPKRLFLDSSTLQTLQDYGEYIYDGGEIAPNDKILSVPDGFQNVDALREIMFVGRRAMFEFALSRNSLQEVLARRRYDYLQWALEMLDYWEGCLASYQGVNPPFSGRGMALAAKIARSKFGYLSQKDTLLIRDAVLLECDAFLTMERRLPKNAPHLERELGIKVLQPTEYWGQLMPWAALFA